jgi:hypothetical protein
MSVLHNVTTQARQIGKAGWLVTVLLSGLLTTTARAEGQQDFKLLNKTGYTIAELYVSPSKVNNWQDDVLGQDVLPNDSATEVQFSREEDTCHWDLKVVYQDGEGAEWDAFNLCEVSEIELFYDRKKGETWAEYQ